MAVFSTNQNRQLYVVKAVKDTTPSAVGDLQVIKIEDAFNKQVTFKYFGQGGLMRTDLIDTDKINYIKVTPAEELQRKLKKATITLDANVNEGNPIAGQDYILRVIINNYLAPGDDNSTVKYGAVHAVAGMTPEAFYTKLAKSLEMNFSREVQPLLTFTASAEGVEIKEVEQPSVRGFMSKEPVNFEVIATTITYEGDDVIWATRDEDDKIPVVESTDIVKGGHKIADLEYFCMGERGDQYRDWACAPNRIPVKYMVEEDKEYAVLDMHYAFSDTGVNVQKSEKDITFVAENAELLNTIITKLGQE